MRVLFLINNLGGGGAERVLVNLSNQMAEDGYDVTLRALVDEGKNRENLCENVKYEYVFSKSFRGIKYLYLFPHKWIYKKVAHGDYDVIIVYLHGVLTRIISCAPKSQKTIAYLHANMEKSPFIKAFRSKEAIQKCFANYDKIVSVSEDIQDSFIKVSGINDNRLTVKYNTFDVKGILERSKEEIAIQEEKTGFTLCAIGKLEEVKGYERLIAVIGKLVNEGFDIRLNIVGEGVLRKELETQIEKENLVENVKLIGFDTNPYKYIANSDLLVCSSYSEGFSSVVAESLILGIPVVTTECAGMKEMLGDNEYGIITVNSEEGIYQGLKQVLSNPELLAYYKEKAKERSAFFSTEHTVGEVEKMIDEVVNTQGENK